MQTRRRVATIELVASQDASSVLAEASAADAGLDEAGEAERGPLRRCVVTRERLPKEQMIRFVRAPDGTIVADVNARLPGRGIWLSARRDVIEKAQSKGAFARASHSAVTIPADLLSVLDMSIERRIGDQLGLARRAGLAVCGFAKVREWLQAGRARLIVQAADGSPEERMRLLGAQAGKVPAILALDAARLGTVFGREHVVHIALAPGRLAESVTTETTRLAGIRGETTQRRTEAGAGRRQEWDQAEE